MFLRRSPAPRRMRSRSALKSSLPRYCPSVSVSPRRTRGSVRRSVMNSAELFLKFLSLFSAMLGPLLTPLHALYRAGENTTEKIVWSLRRHRPPCGSLHVFDEDTTVGARTPDLGEIHAQLARLAPGGVRSVHFPGVLVLGPPVFFLLFRCARVQDVAFVIEHLLDDVPELISRPPHDSASVVYVLLLDLEVGEATRRLLAHYTVGLIRDRICYASWLVRGARRGRSLLLGRSPASAFRRAVLVPRGPAEDLRVPVDGGQGPLQSIENPLQLHPQAHLGLHALDLQLDLVEVHIYPNVHLHQVGQLGAQRYVGS